MLVSKFDTKNNSGKMLRFYINYSVMFTSAERLFSILYKRANESSEQVISGKPFMLSCMKHSEKN